MPKDNESLTERQKNTYIHHNVDGFIDQKTIKTCLWECRTCQCLQDLARRDVERQNHLIVTNIAMNFVIIIIIQHLGRMSLFLFVESHTRTKVFLPMEEEQSAKYLQRSMYGVPGMISLRCALTRSITTHMSGHDLVIRSRTCCSFI